MIRYSSATDDDQHWAPISDLMAVLMLIFMFIAIVFVRTVINQKEVFREECGKLYQVLRAEFKNDFDDWEVKLLPDSTIRFHNPEVLFLTGSHEIRPRFEDILSSFFPRYIDSLREFDGDIHEIRIEGHTSSEYKTARSDDEAYFLNMSLSQNRTRSILKYVLSLPDAEKYAKWARERITANGLSSSRLIRDKNGVEDKILSRRVEFRLLSSSCQRAGIDENTN